MSYYNWEEIFQQKSDEELLKIITDNRTYDEDVRYIALKILKSRKIASSLIHEVDNLISERVLRRERVLRVKIPLEITYSFGSTFRLRKTFPRKLSNESFRDCAEKAVKENRWNISDMGENYIYFEDYLPEDCTRIFLPKIRTTIKVLYENGIVLCDAYNAGAGTFIDYGITNKRIMTFMNFFDDIARQTTTHNSC